MQLWEYQGPLKGCTGELFTLKSWKRFWYGSTEFSFMQLCKDSALSVLSLLFPSFSLLFNASIFFPFTTRKIGSPPTHIPRHKVMGIHQYSENKESWAAYDRHGIRQDSIPPPFWESVRAFSKISQERGWALLLFSVFHDCIQDFVVKAPFPIFLLHSPPRSTQAAHLRLASP